MLKNIRNAFHDYGILFDSKGDSIAWKYIEDLQSIQSDEGLHIANKLTRRHIKYKQNIMNVRLATQTLSSSTKDSLLYLQNTKKYGQQFKDATPTATFCKRINDAFDILNVRAKFSERFETHKISLTPKTKEQLKQHVDEITNYILGLNIDVKVKNRRTKLVTFKMVPVVKSARKCGFIGMIISLKNALDLYDDLHEKYGLEYLLTYKLLQDHIENFFSAVPIKGGFNNNPDAFQFRCAYRRLLIHHDVVSSSSANCEPDDIPILAVSFKKKDTTKEFDESLLKNYDLFQFENLEVIPSELVHDVVQYIGGFITMKITRKTSVQLCPQCSAVLEEGTSASNLVTIKNRGGLKAPSKRVFDVCFHIEQMIRTNKDKIFLPGFIERVIQEILFDHFVHFADTTDHRSIIRKFSNLSQFII